MRKRAVKALVVGGTGPTGPFIMNGLVSRGYERVVLHHGTHEVDFVGRFEHLHADSHFKEGVENVLKNRTFELIIATYGRLRILVDVLSTKTDRIVTVGGTVWRCA